MRGGVVPAVATVTFSRTTKGGCPIAGVLVTLVNVPVMFRNWMPAPLVATMFDAVFQPGKLPSSFADYLRGLVQERWRIRPQSP